MCRTFSFYAAKTGDFYSLVDHTDEHSKIAQVFGLRDNDVSFYAENLAKGEFTPPEDTKLWADLSKWTLSVDERETPAWFDHERARAHMERLIRPMFVTEARNWLVGGCWIFDGEKATAKGVMNGRIVGVINGASLNGANLNGASLYRANLYGASLNGASLDGASLDGASLDGASLDGANLYRANLYRANLDGANLYRANLDGASLYRANLYRANLNGANLYRANLNGANLDGANLDGANLYRANLNGASLYGANLYGAYIHEGASLPAGWMRSESGIITRKP